MILKLILFYIFKNNNLLQLVLVCCFMYLLHIFCCARNLILVRIFSNSVICSRITVMKNCFFHVSVPRPFSFYFILTSLSCLRIVVVNVRHNVSLDWLPILEERCAYQLYQQTREVPSAYSLDFAFLIIQLIIQISAMEMIGLEVLNQYEAHC